ncbi:MAG TPA: hypothetical protein VHX86_12500 [Tepidisphaeraceae bacterium]|nr:hypothetical protein [Tepidisphaeraceae bacterium]
MWIVFSSRQADWIEHRKFTRPKERKAMSFRAKLALFCGRGNIVESNRAFMLQIAAQTSTPAAKRREFGAK